eukprot:7264620-Prymnesium_polylepis.1
MPCVVHWPLRTIGSPFTPRVGPDVFGSTACAWALGPGTLASFQAPGASGSESSTPCALAPVVDGSITGRSSRQASSRPYLVRALVRMIRSPTSQPYVASASSTAASTR